MCMVAVLNALSNDFISALCDIDLPVGVKFTFPSAIFYSTIE